MFFILILWLWSAPSFDYGNTENTIITRVFLPETEDPIVTFESKIIEIVSTASNDGAFIYCRDRIEEVFFDINSELTKIGPYCFSNCKKLKIADLGNCKKLLSFPSFCFSNCIELINLTFPPNLRNVGESALQSCQSLPKIELPESVVSYGGYAFRNCKSITEFYITPKVSSFDIAPWGGCSNLKKIGFIGKSSLSYIGNWGFSGLPLTSLYIPASVTTIGQSIVEGCIYITEVILESNKNFVFRDGFFIDSKESTLIFALPGLTGAVRIPDTIKMLTGSCMSKLSFITEVYMPDSVQKFSNGNHFANCQNLTKINISKSLTKISNSCFSKCVKLEEIWLHEGITSIEASAFADCSGLRRIYIPSTLTTIQMGAFKGTSPDLEFIYAPNATIFVENFHMYTLEYKTVVAFFGDQKIIDIPKKTLHINGQTYQNLKITDVRFTEDSELVSIGDSAFTGCTKLKNIILPSSVQSLGMNCFEKCTSLLNFDLGHSIIGLNTSLLSSAKLESLTIPSTVSEISESAFANAQISAITFESLTTSISIYSKAFASLKKIKSIVLPCNIEKLEKECFYGSEVQTIEFSSPNTLLEIPISCFSHCASLTKIKLPNDCISMSDKAFEECKALTSISLPSSVKDIGVKCFSG